jgi:hypothetical protein
MSIRSTVWNVSAWLQTSAAGGQHIPRVSARLSWPRRQTRSWGGPSCRSRWISRRDRVDMAAELQHQRRARCARCAQSGRRSARGGRHSPLRHQSHRSVGQVRPGAGDRRWPKDCRDRAPAFNQVGLGAEKRHDASSARVDSLPANSCRDRGGRETNSIIRIDHV